MKKILTFKRVMAAFLVVSMLMSFTPAMAFATQTDTDDTPTFTDVGINHWAYQYVEQAVSLGLFSGMTDTTFGPNIELSRSMFVAVLSRMAGAEVDNDSETGFTDVPAGTYFTGAVAWAAASGLVSGMTPNTFGPNVGTTREQAAAFLYRYAAYANLQIPSGDAVAFTDETSISSYAKEAVNAISAAGILVGYTDGTFQPKKVITRAEAATLFVRFMTLTEPVVDPEYYSVSFVANHAVVTVDATATTFCSVQEGESLTFAVEAEESYTVTGISANAGVVTDNGDNTYTISGIENDVIVTIATQQELPAQFTVTFTGDYATAFVDGTATESAVVAAGGSLNFTVTADAGYELVEVIASGGILVANDDGSYTLSGITEDMTVAIITSEISQPPVEPEEYTITFITDEGAQVAVNGAVTQTATTVSTEPFFAFTVALTGEHTQIAEATVSPSGSLSKAGNTYVITGITSDITVTLTTGPELLTVRFNTGAEAGSVESQLVAYGQTATLPEEPTWEGHYFGGWFTDTTLLKEYDFSTPITENTVLYAYWFTQVDVVYLNGTSGSNQNDGATEESAVQSFQAAAKMVKYATSRTIVITGALTVSDTQTWDLSDTPDARVIRGEALSGYDSRFIVVTGFGDLTVNNVHFMGVPDRENNVGTTFLQISYEWLKDENGNNSEFITGTVTLNNCEVEGFGSMPTGTSGYGIYHNYCIITYGTLNINGGAYHENLTPDGGVVNQSTGSVVTVNGGEFYNNEARDHDAVYCNGTGGVFNVGNQILTVNGAVLHDNRATMGGAIYCAAGSGDYLATVNGTTFYNNSAETDGGAVYIASYATMGMTMDGRNVFYGNTAVNGGAIYTGKTLTMGGGTFYDNIAQVNGDAICLAATAIFTLDPDQDGELNIQDTVYIGNSAGIYVKGSLAAAAAPVPVSMAAFLTGKVVATGSDYILTEEELASFTPSDAEAVLTLNTAKNTIEVGEVNIGEDPGGDDDDDEEGSHNLEQVYLNGASGSDSNDGTTADTAVATFGKAQRLLAKDGTIFITGQVTVSGIETWSLNPEVFGNARVLRANSYGNGYLVYVSDGMLTLKDITIDGNNVGSSKGAIYLNGASLTVGENAVLCNNINTGTYASAVYGSSGSTVVMKDGIITNNTASSSYSSAIYLGAGGTFNMSGGVISNNTNTGAYSSAVYVGSNTSNRAAIAISGGEISGNTSTGSYGAAVYTGSYGTIAITGGVITGNTSYTGAVSTSTYGTVNITGGEITNNTSVKSSGGGVSLSSYGSFTMSGGKISGNTAYSYGGGINVGSGSTIELTGGEITDNTATTYGGGIATSTNAKILVDGATITGNEATTYGGGIVTTTSLSEMRIVSGTISGNTAGTYGAGLYIQKKDAATIAPGTDGLTITDEIYFTNTTAASGDRTIYLADLTNLQGVLAFNFANPRTGIIVARPVEGYTLTTADLEKITNTGCSMEYEFDDDGNIISRATAVESITLDQDNLEIMATYTGTLTANLLPANASNLKITWTSSNSTVAAVSGTSLTAIVTAKTPGQAIITAKTADGSFTATCTVTVTENTTPIDSVTVEPAAVKLLGGEQATVTATVAPANAYDTSVTWSTSNASVASITPSGNTVVITAGEYGTAVVSAVTADGKNAECIVTVSDISVESISLSTDAVTVKCGDTVPVGAEISPVNAVNKTVNWISSDTAIATVVTDGINGTIKGVGVGTTTVTATTEDGGYSASVTVTVTEADNNAMYLDITDMDMIIFQTFNVTALFDKAIEDVTWSTGNSEILSILGTDGNQVTVKALDEGTTTITAVAADGQTATCRVTVSGIAAGTCADVYVDSYLGNDSNSGRTAGAPVASYSKAISMLGVNGTLHISSRVDIAGDTIVSLPKEIYGNAKIVVESGNGFTLQSDCNLYFSDVLVECSAQSGFNNAIYMTSNGRNASVYISNGAVFQNGGNTMLYQLAGHLVINGGEIKNFTKSGAYGIIRVTGGDVVMNGGKLTGNSCNTYGGMVALSGSDVVFTMNGGEISGNTCAGNYGGAFAIMTGKLVLRGGKVTGNTAKQVNSSAIYVNCADAVEVDPIYGLELDGNIYLSGSGYYIAIRSALDKLSGSLNLYTTTAIKGTILAAGQDHAITWEDMGKVTVLNAGSTTGLNMVENTITLE